MLSCPEGPRWCPQKQTGAAPCMLELLEWTQVCSSRCGGDQQTLSCGVGVVFFFSLLKLLQEEKTKEDCLFLAAAICQILYNPCRDPVLHSVTQRRALRFLVLFLVLGLLCTVGHGWAATTRLFLYMPSLLLYMQHPSRPVGLLLFPCCLLDHNVLSLWCIHVNQTNKAC